MTVSSAGQSSALARVKTLGPLIALAAVCAVPLLFPGDAPFIKDEPVLIANAFHANQRHELAPLGLQGTRGYPYGPLPTWAYQALLLLSRDLCVLVLVRALAVSAVTALSLAWLSRTAKLWPWFAAVIMLSPYLWFYSRVLWDNSFCIPIAGLAFAAYASLLERETLSSFALVVASLWTLTLIHLMTIALTLPIAVHMLIARRRTLWRYKWPAIMISAFAIGVTHSYWSYLLAAPVAGTNRPSSDAWLFPLFAPRYFSAGGLDYFFGDQFAWVGGAGWMARACSWVSMVAYPLVWGGVVLAIGSVVRGIRRGGFETREHAGIVALGVLTIHVVLSGITGTYFHPHYYNATWIAYAFFAWLCADWLASRATALAAGISVPYAAALAVTLFLIVVSLHRNGGTREHYGPTLRNQIQVACESTRYQSGTPLRSNVLHYQLFPHGIATLRLLCPPSAGEPQRVSGLAIVYASTDPAIGRVRLTEL